MYIFASSPRRGYVVWYHNSGDMVLAFDQFANHNIAINVIAASGYSSSLVILEPNGNVKKAYQSDCDGSVLASSWSQMNHECRVTLDQSSVLTVYQTVSEVTDWNDDSKREYLGATMDFYLNDHVSLWHVNQGNDNTANDDTDEFENLYSVVEDFASPVKYYLEETNSMTYQGGVRCAHSSSDFSALDWSHMSAISEGADVYLGSLRNIDTIVAFNKSGTGVVWSLSSHDEIPSSLRFTGSDVDRFYDIHDAQLVGDDGAQVLLMDDGNNRPDCEPSGFDDEVGCFTRAARYAIDHANGTARLVWQFEYDVESSHIHTVKDLENDDLFVTDGGSATVYTAGGKDSTVVAFTVTDPGSVKYGGFAWIFEVSTKNADDIIAEVRVKRTYWSESQSGMYRAVPFASINGETITNPFADRR